MQPLIFYGNKRERDLKTFLVSIQVLLEDILHCFHFICGNESKLKHTHTHTSEVSSFYIKNLEKSSLESFADFSEQQKFGETKKRKFQIIVFIKYQRHLGLFISLIRYNCHLPKNCSKARTEEKNANLKLVRQSFFFCWLPSIPSVTDTPK